MRIRLRRRAGALPVLAAGLALLACGRSVGEGGGARLVDEVAAARSGAPESAGDSGPSSGDLEELYRARDYFALREALEEKSASGPPRTRFLRAAVLAAFNEPAASNTVVEALLERTDPLPDTLVARAHRLRYHNLLRLHRYRDAVEAGEAALSIGAADPDLRSDLRNELRALRALGDTPPQEVVRRERTLLHRRRGRVPVSVEGTERHYAFDTGANFSILMRSEARSLGLDIREAGVEVGTATDVRVTADVAVARRVRLGGFELRHVVFLVLPDAALTFPGGFQVRGVIGFPILEAFGEIRFGGDGSVEVPERPGGAGPANLALEQLTPLVRVGFRGEALVCRLDTGAGRTNFYEPFLRDHREFVESEGAAHSVRVAGAGGVREIRAFRLPSVRIDVGGRSLGLEGVDVYTRPLVDEGENYLACNLGRDLLDGRGGYVIDFRSMSLTLF